MFERYTEKARRTIFYARYEASQYGSPYIETEHLLLGLLREDRNLALHAGGVAAMEEMQRQVRAATPVREKVSTSVDLPLSNESKRVLAYAAEEAERLGHKHIGTEHLFLGLLRESGSFAANLLAERGVKLEDARRRAAESVPDSPLRGSFGTGVGGGGGGARSIRVAPPEIDFLCGDRSLGHAYGGMVGVWHHIPRIGEKVVLGGQNYAVEDVTSIFETTAPSAQDVYLKRVIIKLKGS